MKNRTYRDVLDERSYFPRDRRTGDTTVTEISPSHFYVIPLRLNSPHPISM